MFSVVTGVAEELRGGVALGAVEQGLKDRRTAPHRVFLLHPAEPHKGTGRQLQLHCALPRSNQRVADFLIDCAHGQALTRFAREQEQEGPRTRGGRPFRGEG